MISQRMVLDNSIAVEKANKLSNLKVIGHCSQERQKVAFNECLYFGDSDSNVSSCLKKACF